MLSSAFARKEDTGSAPLVEDEAVAAGEGDGVDRGEDGEGLADADRREELAVDERGYRAALTWKDPSVNCERAYMRCGIVPIELPATTMPVANARQRRNHCEGSETCAATDQVNLTQ